MDGKNTLKNLCMNVYLSNRSKNKLLFPVLFSDILTRVWNFFVSRSTICLLKEKKNQHEATTTLLEIP